MESRTCTRFLCNFWMEEREFATSTAEKTYAGIILQVSVLFFEHEYGQNNWNKVI